ncbi:hypothetical protein ACOJCM_11805 [Billgrantia sp. LNSP4103-1]
MIARVVTLPRVALSARSLLGTADYCAYPVASMEAETLSLPDNLPPGVVL